MTAQKRLDALEKEIAGIKAEIDTLTEDHTKAVQAGDDEKADQVHARISDARNRHDATQARRGPLEATLATEQTKAQADVADNLTAAADRRLDALEAKIAEASRAAEALAKICDDLDQNAGLQWANAARKAAEAGGTPARRHLSGLGDLLNNTNRAGRKLRHVANDYAQRSTTIPGRAQRHTEAVI